MLLLRILVFENFSKNPNPKMFSEDLILIKFENRNFTEAASFYLSAQANLSPRLFLRLLGKTTNKNSSRHTKKSLNVFPFLDSEPSSKNSFIIKAVF